MLLPSSEISNPVELDQPVRKGILQKSLLQSSLEEFVTQFSLTGGCILRLDLDQSQPQLVAQFCSINEQIDEQVGERSNLAPDRPRSLSPLSPSLGLKLAIDQVIETERLAVLRPLEVLPLECPNSLFPYPLYGCLYYPAFQSQIPRSGPPQIRGYLLIWSDDVLSEHQRYGMRLYAQTLQEQSCEFVDRNQAAFKTTSKEALEKKLETILQRTRHQLRTPAALILLYVDLLKTTPLDDRSLGWLENLAAIAQEMHISLDNLTAATPVELRFFTYDLQELCQECVQELRPWVEQKQLRLTCSLSPLWIEGDRWKIKQVLQNLLSNAIAFSPIGGQVSCELHDYSTEVVIKIRDNGPGLSAEDLRSIGTPFYSRRPGGTGLGLAIAKQIVLEHGGRLWGNNLAEGGAQFCVALPCDRVQVENLDRED